MRVAKSKSVIGTSCSFFLTCIDTLDQHNRGDSSGKNNRHQIDTTVKMGIGQAVVERVTCAMHEKEPFHFLFLYLQKSSCAGKHQGKHTQDELTASMPVQKTRLFRVHEMTSTKNQRSNESTKNSTINERMREIH